jgi:hypothetical protein
MGVRRDETLRNMSQTSESRAKRGTEEADQGSIRALFFFFLSLAKKRFKDDGMQTAVISREASELKML